MDRETFQRLLEENIPYLQQKILNLENFVSMEDFEKLQDKQKEFDALKNNYEKLQEDFDALVEENNNLSSQVGETKNSRLKLFDEVQNFETIKSNLENENKELREKLSAVNETLEKFKSGNDKSAASVKKLFTEVQSLSEEKRTFQETTKVLKEKLSAANETIESLKSEHDKSAESVKKLFAEVQTLSSDKASLQEDKKSLQDEIEASKSKLEEVEKISAELEYYKKTFSVIDSAYKKYLSTDESIRQNLEGIFGDGTSIQGFIFGAANEKHLNEFWEYLRYSMNDGRISEVEQNNLSAVFDFCFDALNKSSSEPIFLRLETEIGKRFDNRTMTRTSDSKQFGNVKKVLLEGYTTAVGNIVQPSLVLIE